MAEGTWYYAQAGQQVGPVSADELKSKLASGQLSAQNLVWREGMGNWEAAGNVREFAGVAPVPDPAAGAYDVAPGGYAPPPGAYTPPGQGYAPPAGGYGTPPGYGAPGYGPPASRFNTAATTARARPRAVPRRRTTWSARSSSPSSAA